MQKKSFFRLLLAVFLVMDRSGFAQKGVHVTGMVTDENGKAITSGAVYSKEIQFCPLVIYAQPNIQMLEGNSTKTILSRNGRFLLDVDAAIPHYIYFTSAGKQTVSIMLPAEQKSPVDLQVILYDTSTTRNENEPSVRSNSSLLDWWIKVHTMSRVSIKTDLAKWMDSLIKYRSQKGTKEGFTLSLESYYNSLISIYNNTEDRQLKNYVLLQLSFLCIGKKYPVERKYMLEAFNKISSSDPMWLLDSRLYLNGCTSGVGGFAENKDLLIPFYESLIENCPIQSEKPGVLYALLNNCHEYKLPEFSKYYFQLLNDYPESDQAKLAQQRMPLKPKIINGTELPAFSVISADQSNLKITNETLRGKLTLIDFWATWCVPCIEQFENMEQVYKKYKGKGFEILSISTDRQLKTVTDFRSKRWKMPWMNGFAGESARQMVADFEIFSIPRFILVDANGKIVECDRLELEGEALDRTLGRLLN